VSRLRRWAGLARPRLQAIVRNGSVDAVELRERTHHLEAANHQRVHEIGQRATNERVATLEAAVQQLTDLLELHHGIVPPPPRHLQERVVGGYVGSFVRSGVELVAVLERLLADAGRPLRNAASVLDFGCGCGRLSRALQAAAPGADLHGCDIDPEPIAWLQANLGGVATFATIPHAPPTAYADGAFDLIVGVSVFTHLPEELQFAWLAELQRITRPEGMLVLTVHGTNHHELLPPSERARLEQDGFWYRSQADGHPDGLPDFYQNAYHVPAYVERVWGRWFEVVAQVPRAVEDYQDAVVLRRAAGGGAGSASSAAGTQPAPAG
jgi:2-polyprenyl-3-methyl-5-hydroxy-6-metoxy-1,4-benzoquinol methylase